MTVHSQSRLITFSLILMLRKHFGRDISPVDRQVNVIFDKQHHSYRLLDNLRHSLTSMGMDIAIQIIASVRM